VNTVQLSFKDAAWAMLSVGLAVMWYYDRSAVKKTEEAYSDNLGTAHASSMEMNRNILEAIEAEGYVIQWSGTTPTLVKSGSCKNDSSNTNLLKDK
jgi:hypothetical protein